jgi:ubiquinone/menaquinone biosynthesis C-methylase UbiE
MRQPEHRIFAATYDRMSRSAEQGWLGELRARLLRPLRGDVLEIGAGTGLNLPHYRDAATVVLTEPDSAMRRRLASRLPTATVPVELVDAAAEDLPFPDGSFDVVVCTLVLCTVVDPDRALAEIKRVLRPDGELVLVEHVRGQARLARWQDRLTPLWTRIGAGCHPNRDTRSAVERAGFDWRHVKSYQHQPNWLPTSPVLEGVAVLRG